MSQLALAIIAKDEEQQLKRIVDSYSEYFDEIAIAYDTNVEKLREMFKDNPKVKIWKYQWRDDFSHKRNFLASKIESEYYFRIDTDDSIAHPERIRELFKIVVDNQFDMLNIPYIYSLDEDKNCNAKHWRETLIKKSPNHYWKKTIHENIYVEDVNKFRGGKDDRVAIVHNKTEESVQSSARRNFQYLIKEYERDKENTDPRTLAYIGRMLTGFGEWKKALIFLEKLVAKSGWEDDRYFAWVEIAQCHLQLADHTQSIAACNEALALNTDFPDAYITLCEIYLDKKDYKKALHWGAVAKSKKEPDTLCVLDPTRYTKRLAMNMAMAFFGYGDYEHARLFYDEAFAYAPSDKFIASRKKLFYDAYEADKYIKHLSWMVFYLKEHQPALIPQLLNSIPKNILKDERVHGLRHKYLPPKEWSKKSVVFFCGNSWEEWADPSVIRGIGGSEEAVIYLSRELVKLGYDVTVFNSCGDFEGEYRGVKYKPFWEFNPNDTFNILIAWRGSIFKSGALKANRKLIWLHDVPTPDQFTESEVSTFDKVIVLSEYHKSLLPSHIPEEKISVSSNGINIKDFNLNGTDRNPKRMIYTSSYDRGIQHLLLMWKDILKEVPDAELHLFYGWDCFDRMAEQGFRNPSFKQKMVSLMNQPNVYEHGRVGHKKLVKEFEKSGLYVYPCHFEEISCISAMKAQACGCVPVIVNYAALKETIKDGVRVDGKAGVADTNERYKEALIKTLKSDQSKLRGKVLQHKDEFGWDKVAKQWDEKLF